MLTSRGQITQARRSNGSERAPPLMATPVRGLHGFGPVALDPITQLVSFPSFHDQFPRVFAHELAAGRSVGIAIGDVDDLKSYVERRRARDDLSFGHLAGNALMSRLGSLSLEWFDSTDPPACLATFGGDEVIVAMVGVGAADLGRHVRELSDRLSRALPCTVSFAHATFSSGDAVVPAFSLGHYQRALVLVDRALFAAKQRPGAPRVVALRPRTMHGAGWRVAPGRRGR